MYEECASTNIFLSMITTILHKKIQVSDKELKRCERKKETKSNVTHIFLRHHHYGDRSVMGGHLCCSKQKNVFVHFQSFKDTLREKNEEKLYGKIKGTRTKGKEIGNKVL
jgi:hypothetical protein